MIAILVERGLLAWDTTIENALPHLAENMRAEYRDVTLEMLLAHRGGIRHEWDVPGLWDVLWKREGPPVEQRETTARAMLSEPSKVRPGSYFYSNCGYGIAGHMAETVSGKPWEELMDELVFDPLGMRSAVLPPSTVTQAARSSSTIGGGRQPARHGARDRADALLIRMGADTRIPRGK